MKEGQRQGEGIQVIQRVADILRIVGEGPEGVSFRDLIQRAELPRSTVYRIVAALEREGFLLVNKETGRVLLGHALYRLTSRSLGVLSRAVRSHLIEISYLLNETVDLAILQDRQVFFVDQVLVENRLQAVSAVGTYFPVYCTANGKAILAELSDEEVEAVLPEDLVPLTPYTIVSKDRLMAELDIIRREHIAYDREEHTLGICGMGFAVRDLFGKLAAISVPTPAQRFYANEREMRETLLRARAEILEELEVKG